MTRRRPGLDPGAHAVAGTANSRQGTRTEYRIRWKRAHWSASTRSKSRHMQRISDVDDFIFRLRQRGDLCELEVDVRDVGTWAPVVRP